MYLLKKYISQRTKLNGPLFCHYSGKPVTRSQFSSVLNKDLTFMGIGNIMIRSHSFRIGAASSHFEKGISEAEVKILRRWKSNAYKVYIRTYIRVGIYGILNHPNVASLFSFSQFNVYGS